MGSKSGFNLGKGNYNLGQNSGQGGPSKNDKDEKSNSLKVTTKEIVGNNSLEKIPKVVAEVDKIQVQEEQPQDNVVKETANENEDRENVANMEIDGGGPILGKRGRVEGSSSSKKGNERTKRQGSKRMEEEGQEACNPTESTP